MSAFINKHPIITMLIALALISAVLAIVRTVAIATVANNGGAA